ncbi:hypothetical protein Tco_0659456, partial [Tanacetum coccineum]
MDYDQLYFKFNTGVARLESLAASKEVELASLSSQVANLTAYLSGFQLSR